MKKYSFLLFFFLSVNMLQAQDLIDKISNKTCKCLEKKKDQDQYIENFKSCLEDVVFENIKEIKEYYNVKEINEINAEELGAAIGIRITKNCEIAHKYETREEAKASLGKYEVDKTIECTKLQIGKYYYMIPNEANSFDTIHVIIDGMYYLELIEGGKTYSKLSVQWNKCNMKLTFVESNDTFKSKLSRPGDIYEYEVIQNNEKYIVLKLVLYNDVFFIEYYKE